MNRLDRFSFLTVSSAIVLFIFATFYVVYDKSGELIFGIQGRYFIPSAPLVMLALQNSLLGRKIKHRQFWAAAIGMSATSTIMIVMIVTLLQRYYFSYWWDR